MVFIGQGTYGCVYRPPLLCKDGTRVPPGKVSKLMLHSVAKKEVKEYKIIEQIDPENKYYPGKPILCKADPADIRANVRTQECDVYANDPSPEKYSLLFYDDGGVDLGKFVRSGLDTYLTQGLSPQAQTDMFFLNAHNLLKGLHMFAQNRFLHHDIKPGNIVFEPSTYKFMFIDFGLSTKSNKLISEMLAKKDGEQFHWSYPLEFGLMNPSSPYYYSKLTPAIVSEMDTKMRSIFKNNTRQNIYMLKPESYHNVFEFAANAVTRESTKDVINEYVDGFIMALNKRNKMSYEAFIKKSVLSVDIYALGFTLNHMINAFYKNGAMSKPMYNDFRALFEKMFCWDFTERITNTDMLLNMYEQVLVKTGILYRAQSVFENHELKNIYDSSSTPSAKPMTPPTPPSPIVPYKRCPNGTRRNKTTGKCEPKIVPYKRCPNGTRRNKTTGKCEPKDVNPKKE